jgi:serine/threonine protein phosphatase PrpC
MNYTIEYHIGRERATRGINEDSVAATVFEDGHREGRSGSGGGVDPTVDESKREPKPRPTRTGGVFVLADGAGGHAGGDVASYIATSVVSRELTAFLHEVVHSRVEDFGLDVEPSEVFAPRSFDHRDFEEAIADAVTTAHRAILRYARDATVTAYTTVVVGLHLDGRLYYGWVGDSRLYVVNGARDRIDRLSTDHSWVRSRYEDGELDEVESMVHPDGRIERALGGGPEVPVENAAVDVDTDSVELFGEDTVLLTSDGLVDSQTDRERLRREYVERGRTPEAAEMVREELITDEQIRDVALRSKDIDTAARTYVREANDLGGSDNVSVLLYEEPALPSTPAEGPLPGRENATERPLIEQDTVVDPVRKRGETDESGGSTTDTDGSSDEPDDGHGEATDRTGDVDERRSKPDSEPKTGARTDEPGDDTAVYDPDDGTGQ